MGAPPTAEAAERTKETERSSSALYTRQKFAAANSASSRRLRKKNKLEAQLRQPTFCNSLIPAGATLATVTEKSSKPAEPDESVLILGSSRFEIFEERTADVLGLLGAFEEISDGESYMATPRTLGSVEDNGDGINSASLIMLVESGTSRKYLDGELARGIQLRMTNYAELKQSHRIVTAGNRVVEDIATGTISGAVTDRDGKKRLLGFSVIIVPGLRRHLFSVAAVWGMAADPFFTLFNRT